ncbi:MAG: type II secretion system minor pseudopilin GspJ [Pseudomonadota bacterium]
MRTGVRGFTLLEVLVAISIFAIVGLGAHQLLTLVIDSHERARTISATYADAARVMMVLERDLSQITNRSVRDEYGEPLPALMVATGVYGLEFTRSGWNNPVRLARSSLQRVAYELKPDGTLVRHLWRVLDRAEDSAPTSQTLLDGVQDFRIFVYNEEGDAADVWPDFGSTTPLPAAIEILLVTETLGELRRFSPLVEAARNIPGGPGTGPETDDDAALEGSDAGTAAEPGANSGRGES